MFKCRKLIPWGNETLTQSMFLESHDTVIYVILSLLENAYVACLQRNYTEEKARVLQQYRPAQKETVSMQWHKLTCHLS